MYKAFERCTAASTFWCCKVLQGAASTCTQFYRASSAAEQLPNFKGQQATDRHKHMEVRHLCAVGLGNGLLNPLKEWRDGQLLMKRRATGLHASFTHLRRQVTACCEFCTRICRSKCKACVLANSVPAQLGKRVQEQMPQALHEEGLQHTATVCRGRCKNVDVQSEHATFQI